MRRQLRLHVHIPQPDNHEHERDDDGQPGGDAGGAESVDFVVDPLEALLEGIS